MKTEFYLRNSDSGKRNFSDSPIFRVFVLAGGGQRHPNLPP